MAKDREGFVGMALANATVIFAKDDVKFPMEPVLDAPVRSDRVAPQLRIGLDTADEMAHFTAGSKCAAIAVPRTSPGSTNRNAGPGCAASAKSSPNAMSATRSAGFCVQCYSGALRRH